MARALAAATLCALLSGCYTAQVPMLQFSQTQRTIAGEQKHVVIVAHMARGFGGPENSLEAIGNCVKNGVTSVEVDIKYTKDRVPMLFHDDKLWRTTDGNGRIEELEYKKIDAKLSNGEPIPTLESALKKYGGKVMFYLDMKEKELGPTVDVVARNNMMRSVYFLLKSDTHYEQAKSLLAQYPDMIIMPRIEDEAQMRKIDGMVPYKIAKVHEKLPRNVVEELNQRGVVLSANMIMPWHWNNLPIYVRNGVRVVQTDRPSRYLKSSQLPVEPPSRAAEGDVLRTIPYSSDRLR